MMIKTNKDNKVFAFYREKDGNRVVVFLNLSKKSIAIKPALENIRWGVFRLFYRNQNSSSFIRFIEAGAMGVQGFRKVKVKDKR